MSCVPRDCSAAKCTDSGYHSRTEPAMFILIRAITYSSLFIGFLLLFLPARILAGAGITRPPLGATAWLGVFLAAIGSILALWCIFTFVAVGRGTPAPFDPPRRLVE